MNNELIGSSNSMVLRFSEKRLADLNLAESRNSRTHKERCSLKR